MTIAQELRDQLQADIFDVYGTEVTFIKKSSPIYNNRGEIISNTTTSSTVKIVPFNMFLQNNIANPWGETNEGSIYAVVPHSVSVALEDQILMNDKTLVIKEVVSSHLVENVAWVIELVEDVA